MTQTFDANVIITSHGEGQRQRIYHGIQGPSQITKLANTNLKFYKCCNMLPTWHISNYWFYIYKISSTKTFV